GVREIPLCSGSFLDDGRWIVRHGRTFVVTNTDRFLLRRCDGGHRQGHEKITEAFGDVHGLILARKRPLNKAGALDAVGGTGNNPDCNQMPPDTATVEAPSPSPATRYKYLAANLVLLWLAVLIYRTNQYYLRFLSDQTKALLVW